MLKMTFPFLKLRMMIFADCCISFGIYFASFVALSHSYLCRYLSVMTLEARFVHSCTKSYFLCNMFS